MNDGAHPPQHTVPSVWLERWSAVYFATGPTQALTPCMAAALCSDLVVLTALWGLGADKLPRLQSLGWGRIRLETASQTCAAMTRSAPGLTPAVASVVKRSRSGGKDTLLSDSGPSFSTMRVGAELLTDRAELMTDRAWLLTDTRTNDLAIRISISLIDLCDFTKWHFRSTNFLNHTNENHSCNGIGMKLWEVCQYSAEHSGCGRVPCIGHGWVCGAGGRGAGGRHESRPGRARWGGGAGGGGGTTWGRCP